jgi:hypothetical protein
VPRRRARRPWSFFPKAITGKRRAMRDALARTGLAARIDALVAKLLDT